MNLPNKLSIFRIFCILPLVVLMYFTSDTCRIAAIILFSLASFSDFLDGYLARRNKMITTFGKFIDPLADKLLNLSALIMLTYQGLIMHWVIIIILARELAVDGLRLIAASKGKILAAGQLGKIKTCSQMITILFLMIFQHQVFFHPISLILIAWIVIITLWSGIDYFMKNRIVFGD